MTHAAASQQVSLRIIGMHCAGCVATVERALKNVDGVTDASVQLLTESADVRLATDVPTSRLIAAVRSAGYDARPAQTGSELEAVIADDRGLKETLRTHRQAIIQAVMYAVPIIALDHLRHHLWPHTASGQIAPRLMQLALLIMMMASVGAPILAGGLRGLASGAANMDSLISLGVLAATLSSIYGTLIARDDSFVHFHAAAMILGLVVVGRYLEARARAKANAAMLSLARRSPKTARVQRGDDFVELPLEEILAGDILRVLTGEAIATDGQILDGRAAIDESVMTGEPLPKSCGRGDSVLGGSIVVEGSLTIRATAAADRGLIGRILAMVRQAQTGRTQAQRQADRLAAVLTPIIIAIAIATFAAWLIFVGRAALADATRSTVAVLVVACPCALGLATPAVIAVASGLAALRGILVRDAAMLESMAHVSTVIWDKTGTLTVGWPDVQRVHTYNNRNEDDVLRLAAAVEQFSTHPIAKAIVAEARQRSLAITAADNAEVIPGSGASGRVEGYAVLVGSTRFLKERGIDAPSTDPAATGTEAFVAIDGALAGVIELADSLRPAAREAVARLRSMGVESELLTGDRPAAAESIARELAITSVTANARPADKVARVRAVRAAGQRVAMVGDGINDAAALAEADVGIAFATGADIAAEAAGVNLIGHSPALVADAVQLARASLRVIRQNLWWAFIYNALMIPLAATGRLAPGLAAGAMMISSLTVVLNALRLSRVVGRR